MYKIMSNHCTYSELNYEALEPTILVEEDVIWEGHESDNVQEQETVPYADDTDADCTLTETGNESYVTASGDNTTQYFSVLDSSNQTILNDISDVTINNSVIHEEVAETGTAEENNFIDINSGQVVLFRVDGTDELYGFQLIHDEDGNLQKYQFKVRESIEGNLEAVPETLQILPVDSLVNEEPSDEVEQANIQSFEDVENNDHLDNDHTVLVKEERPVEQSTSDDEETFEEPFDTKEGILELSANATSQKQERHEQIKISNHQSHDYIENPPQLSDDELEEEEIFYSHEDVNENTFAYNNAIQENPVVETAAPAGHYEELFVKESHLIDDANGTVEENGIGHLNDSETEEYDTVEGVHVTGDIEGNHYENADIRKSPSYQASLLASRKRIIKNVIRKVRIQKNDGKSNLYYLVKKNTEKENMGQIPSNSITARPNPRSILKCSIAATETQNYEDEEEKYDKRFAKSKEAQQARLFHNFIAQTKIIHAPVRQERLPRKQQIKPMKRTDEEIVVQEVVVSSNGFIETSEEGIVKERVPLKPTEYIQLTDSDEDFDPRAPHKRKRKIKRRKPMVEITISDSEENSSEESARDDDNNSDEIATAIVKRPRGRPPKNHDKEEEKEVIKRPRGRPPKNPKPQTETLEEEIIVIKIDNKCPKCPKSFPSEGSLRSHMQYHNFSQTSSNDTKYMCEKCGDTFKNSFLLNKHINSHKTSNIVCGICKKVFSDQAQLATHKRTHIKQQMFKNTTLPKNSPKVFKNAPKNKCETCNKVFSNVSALNIHKKTHKRLFCRNCKTCFTTKFTFDNHLRVGCVKTSRSPKKPPPLPDKKPLILRQSIIPIAKMEEVVVPKSIPSKSTVITNIKCDSCSMTFATYTSLFKHKVLKHGLDTPSKSVTKGTKRKSLYRNRTAHSGVRPTIGLKTAFAGLQNKLEALKSSQKKT